MRKIGLELSDAGILAVDHETGSLLSVDGQDRESPGFALPSEKGLLVGKDAESKAHLLPHQIMHDFWDHLDAEPLDRKGAGPQVSTAEIAYHHLNLVWNQIREFGDELIIAVPGFYSRRQLGFLLGIANELSMPVSGFVPMALAAATDVPAGKIMFHLDIHLHRMEVTHLRQGERLTLEDSVTASEKGLLYLYKQWAEAIGREFVDSTRFDPFHRAASEQELYHRLPGILSNLQQSQAISFGMTGGSRSYGITLTRDVIVHKAQSAYMEMRQLVEGMRRQYGHKDTPVVLQLSHRLVRLPGCRQSLAEITNAVVLELPPGAGAKGCLQIWPELSDQKNDGKISFYTSRQPKPAESLPAPAQSVDEPAHERPTHLLAGSTAYRIPTAPLFLCIYEKGGKTLVKESKSLAEEPAIYFSVQLSGGEVFLRSLHSDGAFVDETLISGSTALKPGQTLRAASSAEIFHLIVCRDANET